MPGTQTVRLPSRQPAVNDPPCRAIEPDRPLVGILGKGAITAEVVLAFDGRLRHRRLTARSISLIVGAAVCSESKHAV